MCGVLPGFSAPFSGFNGGGQSFDWHSVIVEFVVNWQLRCSTGNECVHVSNLPMQVPYPADTSSVYY